MVVKLFGMSETKAVTMKDGQNRESGKAWNSGRLYNPTKKAVNYNREASFAAVSSKIHKMSQTVSIASGAQFGALLKSSNIVITDCNIAPLKTTSQY